MEATGYYRPNLYTWLSDKDFRLHVINPLHSDALRYICHKLLNTVFAILKTGKEYKPVYPSQLYLTL